MPLSFGEFLGNRDMVTHFLQAAQLGRIPPALLLTGPEGVGKKTFALLAAQYLNCHSPQSEDVCGRCLSCLKMAQGLHPDLRLVVPDGNQLKIGQMRELSADLQFRPFEGRRKVYILDQADRLNEEAANSILKTLEECPLYAWVVLVSAHPNALPATIRSRCPAYRFAPVPPAEIERLLQSRGAPAERAQLLSRISDGSVAAALTHDWEQIEKERDRALSLLEHLATADSFCGVHNFWQKLTSEERARPRLEGLLQTLLALLRDLLLVKEKMPDAVVHRDIVSRLGKHAAAYSFDRIAELETQIRNALREMQRNVNAQILIESLYFERRDSG